MEPEQIQPPKHQPKIPTPVAFILIVVAIIADLINWIPGVNIIVTILTLGYQFYFWSAGVPGFIGIIGNVIEFIPGLSVIPALTAAISLTVYVDRHPESWIGKKVLEIAAKLKAARGGGGSAAAAAPRIRTPKGALGKAQ